MDTYKTQFIDFMLACNVLRFGDFVTKSGRNTPYFINTGNYDTGSKIARLGEFYAEAMRRQLSRPYTCLYGPAYKGIPLVVTTAASLARDHNRDLPFCFNRKEAKDHGEGGTLVGHKPLSGERIVIIEDVTTAGTSVRESADLLHEIEGVRIVSLVVSVDRQEHGQTEQGALRELADEFGIETTAIVTLDEIIEYIQASDSLDEALIGRMLAYRETYGCD